MNAKPTRLRAGLYEYRGHTIERNDGWSSRYQGVWVITNTHARIPEQWDLDFLTLKGAVAAINFSLDPTNQGAPQ